MILPMKRRFSTKKDPNRMLIFGAPKTGKTTVLANLEDALIVDMEEGSDYVDAMVVKINNLTQFKDLMKSLDDAKKANDGKMPYKYIVLDTLTALEEMSLPLAKQLYMQTPMGANFQGSDVRTLANGAGYLYTRAAFFKMVKPFEKYCDTLIMVGHVKEKDVTKEGESFTERSINLTGKTKDILCAWCDSIGLIYREENKTIINFAPSDKLIVGSRQKHLIGQKIVLAESDEDHNLTIDWDKVFIDKQE
jgi:hypothetical protein